MAEDGRRVQQHRAAADRRKLGRLSPRGAARGRRDGHRRRHQAARTVVVVPDRDVRRRARQDAVRGVVRRDRPDQAVSRRQSDHLRHATQRLDVHARSPGARVAAADGHHVDLRGERAPGAQRQLLRPVRRRGGLHRARRRAVLPEQRQTAICGRAAGCPRPTSARRIRRASTRSGPRPISRPSPPSSTSKRRWCHGPPRRCSTAATATTAARTTSCSTIRGPRGSCFCRRTPTGRSISWCCSICRALTTTRSSGGKGAPRRRPSPASTG